MIAPSILSVDFSCLKKEILKIEKTGVKWIHLDVMDGSFVPNITFGPSIIKSIRKNTKLFLDVHLMIINPDKHIESFKNSGANSITVSIESCDHIDKTIKNIKNLGCKVGVALNPGTSLKEIEWIISNVDLILLMSVNPGFGGQKFIKQTLYKIVELKNLIIEKKSKALIQVDGGICLENIESIKNAGANIFVVGSAFFNKNNIKKTFNDLNDKILK